MMNPKWRQSLDHSLQLQSRAPESKFFQVASLGVKGSIENRTMVFRGFAEASNTLLAITDIRSEKYQEWIANPSAQLCWYFTQTREQFRISAKVRLLNINVLAPNTTANSLNAAEIINITWNNLSPTAKQQFDWPAPKTDTIDIPKAPSTLSSQQINKHFVVVCFDVYKVDYLNLTTIPQTREIHTKLDLDWQFCRVNA